MYNKHRLCFKCSKPLGYHVFIAHNTLGYTGIYLFDKADFLTKIWNNNIIELYCCNCAREAKYSKLKNYPYPGYIKVRWSFGELS